MNLEKKKYGERSREFERLREKQLNLPILDPGSFIYFAGKDCVYMFPTLPFLSNKTCLPNIGLSSLQNC